ncbi:MAG: protein-glutamate O-methyltransferase CheR [Rickettsiales bacterium]|nr:protein-glutamate O-methyltransferase CheR [Rickettsiales bacterium]
MKLNEDNIRYLQSFIKTKTGIALESDKNYLLESRITPIARKFGLKSFDELITKIRINTPEIINSVIDAITTNETYFFRDIKPFEFFQKNTLSDIVANTPNSATIKILSSACSSGQEAYSLAMLLNESKIKLNGRDFFIKGFDLSPVMVERARQGIFNQFEVQRGLQINYLIKYFQKIDENNWKIKDDIKKKCSFYEANLLSELPENDEFDCIFARNVLIYFDDNTKRLVLNNLISKLKKGGSIYLGSSETLNILPEKLHQTPDFRSVYKKI